MSVLKKFVSDEIVPDLIDEAPKTLLKVSYSGGVTVDGGELTPTQVKDEPKVEWQADDGSFYTLLMTDPDAPSRKDPKFGEVRHWLVVNIPGSDINAGETKYQYIGSGPPSGSGLHRYIFLVFEQSKGKQEFDVPTVTNRSREGRLSTKTRKLIADYNLQLVAGNFYFAKFDDYVPILQAQLSGAPPKA